MDFSECREKFNRTLESHLESINEFNNLYYYAALNNGKRIRPLFIYALLNDLGYSQSRANHSAVAVELIHTYSLIHDDLPSMDDDDIRHGKAALHIKYGEAKAILTGDSLQSIAFKVITDDSNLSDSQKVLMCNKLAVASYQMAIGQLEDIDSERDPNLEDLKKMYQNKTGALLKFSIESGIIISENLSKNDSELLLNYIEDIGLAYQIQDDVLDIKSSTETLGKRNNSDVKLNKNTFPSIVGIKEAEKIYSNLYKKSKNTLDKMSFKPLSLMSLTEKIKLRDF